MSNAFKSDMDTVLAPAGSFQSKLGRFFRSIKNQQALLLMTLPFLAHLILFRYVPLVGWIMAFQDFTVSNINESWFSQKLVGFKHFVELFSDATFRNVIVNTLAMAFIKLIFGTVFSILVAVLINETKNKPFKKSVQVISYLPHFVSWVVAANIFLELLSPRGVVNQILVGMHLIKEPVLWMGKPKLFWWIIGMSHVWKTAGFGAIIYLASMTAIDPQLYEAANMDGAGRIRQIVSITLPSIKPTIVILLIISIGQLMEAGFEQQYLLRNPIVKKYSDVLTIYILEYGIRMTRYSFAAAAGIFKSVVSLTLVLSANFVAKKMGEETLM